MNPDSLFRLVTLLLVIAMMSGALTFRLRAARANDKLDRRQEGLLILISLRLTGVGLWLALFAWLINPGMFPDALRLPLPDTWRWAGAPLVVLAGIWTVWVMRTLGHNLTDTVVTRANASLVTSGPYRYVRHPLYTGLLPLTVGLMLLTSIWLFSAVGMAVLALLVVRTSKEEAKLIERFGDSYRAYMMTTGRFLPRLSGSTSGLSS